MAYMLCWEQAVNQSLAGWNQDTLLMVTAQMLAEPASYMAYVQDPKLALRVLIMLTPRNAQTGSISFTQAAWLPTGQPRNSFGFRFQLSRSMSLISSHMRSMQGMA